MRPDIAQARDVVGRDGLLDPGQPVGVPPAQVRGYDIEGARTSVLAAADLARAVGDGETLGRAVLVMEGVSDFLWDPVGRSLAVEALATLPPNLPSALRARLLATTVVMDSWRNTSDAGPQSLAALAMAEQVNDRRALVVALRARQFACGGPEGAEDRLALGTRLLGLGADGDTDALLWGRLWRFDAYAQLGDLRAVASEVEDLAALADVLVQGLAVPHPRLRRPIG